MRKEQRKTQQVEAIVSQAAQSNCGSIVR